jgi:molybdate transport system substrate-binding protein
MEKRLRLPKYSAEYIGTEEAAQQENSKRPMMVQVAVVRASRLLVLNAAALLSIWCAPASCGEVSAAVAANFTVPAKEIAAAFKAKTGDAVDLSFGATGPLYAQITQGAPFDVFLSADSERAKKAETGGFAVAGSRFTYALGKLVLWSADAALIDPAGAVLKSGRFRHLALANPAAAPYGAAAAETLTALGLYNELQSKLVMGENIAQTFQFIVTGNAELGFVALSQAIEQSGGSRWPVPESLYAPILQDAVLLRAGEDNRSARAFLSYLKSPEAARIIRRYGYGLPAGR